MKDDSIYDNLIEQYYAEIYRYCYSMLNYNTEYAKDVAQEVFLTLIRKQKELDFSGNIRAWLYATAERLVKQKIRTERPYREAVPINEMELADSGGFGNDDKSELFDSLTEEEYQLLCAYYDAGHAGKSEVAERFGLTLPRLYDRIRQIKKKLRKNHQKSK
ncbi:MAG: sigma-70 family RNA polymerase sigma factor [Clostridia bacterium]|nr:sigma-70 family RNA polymerase sigma factor [Clostridia bacterium]